MRRLIVALALTSTLVFVANCSPSRSRPGPPRLTVDFPGGTNVTSPDTFSIEILAVDADGLDSLSVRWLNETTDFDTGFNVEAAAQLELAVPANLNPGLVLTVWVRARDLFGQASDEITTITVVTGAP